MILWKYKFTIHLACVCMTIQFPDEEDLILPDSGWHEFTSVHVQNGKTTGRGEVPDQRQNLLDFIDMGNKEFPGLG